MARKDYMFKDQTRNVTLREIHVQSSVSMQILESLAEVLQTGVHFLVIQLGVGVRKVETSIWVKVILCP